MNRRPENEKTRVRGGANSEHLGSSSYMSAVYRLYGTSQPRYIPKNWRERLPDPSSYYGEHVESLGNPNGSGWAACRCPFHNDKHASASVNLTTGAFRCHGCDAKGDMVSFHQRITGSNFKEAVRDLLGMEAHA